MQFRVSSRHPNDCDPMLTHCLPTIRSADCGFGWAGLVCACYCYGYEFES
ncbi:hypothetical protein CJF30_00005256 [Rutstroemia sp. NJR-2017a BBW]|nr:hypothetical protein CJF30_00005256 [Rutstroemia sp. NJR-2017a BBW]